ncbi:MAG: peptidoglycan-binding domain-containing protein [Acidobacteria bacterium]|nr:peptidoglycan-binding domain-containing protein [Acidobacteriota bacterium]
MILGAVLVAAPVPQTKASPTKSAPAAAAPKPGAAKPAAPPKKSSSRASLKPTPVKPTPVKPSSVKPRRATPSKIGPRRAAAAPPRQSQPSPERYRQIQQALIDKGFLEGEPSGQWDQRSIDALKKFEESQQLRNDGKIDSMALIALGLGPKRTPLPASPLPGTMVPPAPQN